MEPGDDSVLTGLKAIMEHDFRTFFKYRFFMAGLISMNLADLLIMAVVYTQMVSFNYFKFVAPGIVAVGLFAAAFVIGRKKRVEVAKVLIQRPKVAIVDEPTAQIDIAGKYQIWEKIRSLRDEGSTIILATNELGEADRLSDRVAIMYHGRLRICDTPRNLKDSIPGGDVIDIRLEAPVENSAVSQLKGIAGVVDIAFTKPTHMRIYLNRVEKMLPQIMQLLSTLGVAISSINMKEPSLDDVFFHYTGAILDESQATPGVSSS